MITPQSRVRVLAAAEALAANGKPENLSEMVRLTGLNFATVRRVRAESLASEKWPTFKVRSCAAMVAKAGADPSPKEIAERAAEIRKEWVKDPSVGGSTTLYERRPVKVAL